MPRSSLAKSWTVMVYMAGDNNLDPEGVEDLKEMKRVGSTSQVNVIAQFDRAAGHVARRYYLRKGGLVTSDAVASLGKVNTGDPANLTDFIQWGLNNYPAKRYLLVLWNHGQGWDDTDIYAGERFTAVRRLATGPIQHAFFRTPVRDLLKKAPDSHIKRAILLDDNAKDFLDNHEMKKVLAGLARKLGRKLDILGMDACLMSMAEIGYQIKNSVAYTVGSEQTEPAAGWPYQSILKALTGNPALTPAALSALIVDQYLASYTRSDAVTYAACDLSKSNLLAAAVRNLAATLKKSLKNPAALRRLQAVRDKVQSYEVPDNIDLIDFCQLLGGASAEPSLKAACKKVVEVASKLYVLKQGFKSASMKHSYGVAIYFPIQEVSPLYAGLDFSKKTGWDGFLKAYRVAVRSR